MTIPNNYLRCMHRPPTLRQPGSPVPAPIKPAMEPQAPQAPQQPETPGSVKFTIPGAPMGKPRMTQRDKWQKRPCVMRYRAWADKAQAAAVKCFPLGPLPDVISLSWTAFLPIPLSWSRKKQQKMEGTLHRQKPDRDNIDKAVLDALFKSDCQIAQGYLEKRWDDGNGPRIEVTVGLTPGTKGA